MRLWLLISKRESDYDTACGFVVRAETEQFAREFAAGDCGDEREDTWLSPEFSSCEVLADEGKPGVVLRDYRGG